MKGVQKMLKHTIHSYLNDYTTLTPTDTQVGAAVVASDWWSDLKTQFDDLLWMYFDSRSIFVNPKFDPADRDTTAENIVRTFAIMLKSKQPQLDKLYAAVTADYNPIWNVDGVTGTVSQDTHTGTDTNAKTGNDATTASGNDVNRLSGSDINSLGGHDTHALSGTDTETYNLTKDDTTRTGSVGAVSGGSDVNSHGKFTFDDQVNLKHEGVDSTEYGKTETTTYNSLKDAHVANSTNATAYGKNDRIDYGKTDTTNYGKVDTTTYGKTDTTTYNSSNTETRNLLDEHVDMVIRQGNIGVVTSQSMVVEEQNLRTSFDFFYYVVHLCVNQVAYGVVGV